MRWIVGKVRCADKHAHLRASNPFYRLLHQGGKNVRKRSCGGGTDIPRAESRRLTPACYVRKCFIRSRQAGVVGIANRNFSLLDEDEREDDRNDDDWGKRHAQRSAGLCRLKVATQLLFEAI